jgi:hypothetical protein
MILLDKWMAIAEVENHLWIIYCCAYEIIWEKFGVSLKSVKNGSKNNS